MNSNCKKCLINTKGKGDENAMCFKHSVCPLLTPTRADKHLEPCTENCKYATKGICAFGLRNRLGCYLDNDVKEQAGLILSVAKEQNIIEIAKSIAKGKL